MKTLLGPLDIAPSADARRRNVDDARAADKNKL